MSIAVSELVWAHRGLDPTAKLILLRLANAADDSGGSVFPSIPRVAADCGCDERTAQRAIGRLRESGLVVLVAEADAMKRRAREYRIDTGALKAGGEPPAQRHPRHSATPGTAPPLADCHPRQIATSPPAQCHPSPGTAPPLTVIEPSVNRQKSRRTEDDAEFIEFWSAFPRRVAKGAARKAWNAATKKSPAAAIIAAATSFAHICRAEGKPEQYIPHPSTWLNAERWLDGEDTTRTVPDLLSPIQPALPVDDDAIWQARAAEFRGPRPGWRAYWGPDLLDPRCRVPSHLIHLFKTGE